MMSSGMDFHLADQVSLPLPLSKYEISVNHWVAGLCVILVVIAGICELKEQQIGVRQPVPAAAPAVAIATATTTTATPPPQARQCPNLSHDRSSPILLPSNNLFIC
ncbi:hypothetical protein Q3G72_017246 [Acer saccharum]|nr:hypothetical protein Q3G72_017246 [Acer saccharum]